MHTGQLNQFSLGSQPDKPTTKEAHEVQQIEPAYSGLFHRPSSGHLFLCLRTCNRRLCFRGLFRRLGDIERTERSRPSRWTPSPAHCAREQPTVSSGGVNPVSMAVTSDYANLYVANASASSNSIVHFAIDTQRSSDVKDTVTLSSYTHCHGRELSRNLPVCGLTDPHPR